MLEMNRNQAPVAEFVLPPTPYDWKWMAKSLLRGAVPTLLITAVCAVLAFAYVQMRPSHYTAQTILNITNLRLSSADQETFYAEALFDPTFLETQIQIISSEPIVRTVISGDAVGMTEQEAINAFRRGLVVERVGQSNLVSIAYTDASAERAADMANAVAEAYIEKLGTDRERAVQSASSWLRDRLRGVGAQAQIVSEATPPLDKSDTRGILIIAGTIAAGGLAGIALALVVGFFDRRIRDPRQVATAAGVECLGIVPALPFGFASGGDTAPAGEFSFASALSRLHEVDRGPVSPVWQALRSAGVVATGSSARTRRVAITSTLSHEGKTTIAANYALLAAQVGKRVLLVDAQSYDPALSRSLTPAAGQGLVEFLAAPDTELRSFVTIDPKTNVHFLPLGDAGSFGEAQRMLWTDRMERLFEQAREYDLIVFDMPPLVATGDLRAAAPFIDSVLLVLQWNAVTQDEVRAALDLAPPIRERLVGAILNKASLSRRERWLSPELDITARQARLAKARR